jgi:hypothetical protein
VRMTLQLRIIELAVPPNDPRCRGYQTDHGALFDWGIGDPRGHWSTSKQRVSSVSRGG